ncbi:hypothetical protein ASU31_10385 [Pedobacter ginsenosidimutans]|uniref:Uncharacterized protein n=1 Tax=Pedobacter ginsenosidimutans TaxID=687842 RepID=A0A0T5VPX5_9SPHI|nr:hypothetical protein [Pedobacter ginsenosidimutans]KRT15910.1 hypothetical protein ASU31_10385 [Pedobacter ginsenosidimutans]
MENSLKIFDQTYLDEYASEYNICSHERDTFSELLMAVKAGDELKLNWFAQFGEDIRQILMNSYAYRKGLVFGFGEICFDEYGWLKRPVFLDQKETELGRLDKTRWGNHSTITVGRGPNGVWCYGFSISWGTAGSCSGLSVYNKSFSSKQVAFDTALIFLKERMEEKLGDVDGGNYNQKIIKATLKDIDKYRVAQVQLSLF